MMNSVTDWLTAIGTVGAVIVALGVVFYERWRAWYNRPILRIEFENNPPYCRTAWRKRANGSECEHYIIRVKVTNDGRSVARQCEGRLEALMDANKQHFFEQFEPVVLPWASRRFERYDPQQGAVLLGYDLIDINHQESEFLEIFFRYKVQSQEDPKKPDIGSALEIASDPTIRTVERRWLPGQYYLKLTIYSENAEPISKMYFLKFEEGYKSVAMGGVEAT